MNKQNEMMDFVWLLNAADNSAFETKGLYLEFLRRKQDFQQVRQSFPLNTSQSDYLEQEIRRNLENLEDLQARIQEVIGALRPSERKRVSND
ncbi:MAG: hypothetical protein LBB91_06815 [Clostridiales bacterium]|jgi:superfamily I DNA and/or RNA helicase|nr:hypothetical protein [Clostridiales bacterium]